MVDGETVRAREVISSGHWNGSETTADCIITITGCAHRVTVDSDRKRTTISAHALMSLVCSDLGIKGWKTERAKDLFTALGKEDFHDAFGIEPITEEEKAKLEHELKNRPSTCDRDHLFGRMLRVCNSVIGFSITGPPRKYNTQHCAHRSWGLVVRCLVETVQGRKFVVVISSSRPHV